MKSNLRSISGALLMLVIIPVFAGLLACMPVPVGDPERSRIDPDLNGFWALEISGDPGAALYFLRPYDKRTWLIIGTGMEASERAELEAPDPDNAEEFIAALREHKIGWDAVTASGVTLYKAWQTKLGKNWFMTWEPIGDIHDEESYAPEGWFVWKMERESENYLKLVLVNFEHDMFEPVFAPLDEEENPDLRKIRKKLERTLRRNADDPELFNEEAYWALTRIPEDLTDKATRLIELAVDD